MQNKYKCCFTSKQSLLNLPLITKYHTKLRPSLLYCWKENRPAGPGLRALGSVTKRQQNALNDVNRRWQGEHLIHIVVLNAFTHSFERAINTHQSLTIIRTYVCKSYRKRNITKLTRSSTHSNNWPFIWAIACNWFHSTILNIYAMKTIINSSCSLYNATAYLHRL